MALSAVRWNNRIKLFKVGANSIRLNGQEKSISVIQIGHLWRVQILLSSHFLVDSLPWNQAESTECFLFVTALHIDVTYT